jgi:hypothetical protein
MFNHSCGVFRPTSHETVFYNNLILTFTAYSWFGEQVLGKEKFVWVERVEGNN